MSFIDYIVIYIVVFNILVLIFYKTAHASMFSDPSSLSKSLRTGNRYSLQQTTRLGIEMMHTAVCTSEAKVDRLGTYLPPMCKGGPWDSSWKCQSGISNANFSLPLAISIFVSHVASAEYAD